MLKHEVTWLDLGVEPQCAPDPNYPHGVNIDATGGAQRCCTIGLAPYPAPRCGYFFVKCHECGMTAVITTAGRPDDPRSVKLACKVDGETVLQEPDVKTNKPSSLTIAELEALLQSEEEAEIEILPNGEVRVKGATSPSQGKPLTMREYLGGEYAGSMK